MTNLLVALGESLPLAVKSLFVEAQALGCAVDVSVAFLAVVTRHPTGNKILKGEFITDSMRSIMGAVCHVASSLRK